MQKVLPLSPAKQKHRQALKSSREEDKDALMRVKASQEQAKHLLEQSEQHVARFLRGLVEAHARRTLLSRAHNPLCRRAKRWRSFLRAPPAGELLRASITGNVEAVRSAPGCRYIYISAPYTLLAVSD